MNSTLYQMANSAASIRVVIQKKVNGGFLLGISNGKHQPLICQGAPDDIDKDLQTRLPAYLEELQAAEIEAKLTAAVQAQLPVENSDDDNDPDDENTFLEAAELSPTTTQPTSLVTAPAILPELNDQSELDFGF